MLGAYPTMHLDWSHCPRPSTQVHSIFTTKLILGMHRACWYPIKVEYYGIGANGLLAMGQTHPADHNNCLAICQLQNTWGNGVCVALTHIFLKSLWPFIACQEKIN